MFGLNDNSDKTNLDPGQSGAGDSASLPPLTATVPADNSAGGSSTLNPNDENSSGTSIASSSTALDNSATATASAGIGDVSLENAYIATDPPQITKRSDDVTKPSAASLVDQDSKEDGELIKLKQQALQDLAPLVDHLEQSNEEKFKTTMMLIQASDNSDLIPDAYEAANKIEDEKVRAQALLDVVNEINYFTQQNNK
jgi:hypothetical protein